MAKKLKWNLILMSVLYLGLGIFLLMRPSTALNVVCYALGGVVLVCAAVQLVRYFAVERGIFQSQLTLISGIICLGLGAFLILRSDIVVRILPIVFGLFVIFDSLGRIQNALDLRRCEYPSWKGFLLLPVLSVVLGVVMILNPFGTMETLVMAIGIILIIEGAINLLSALYTVLALRRFAKLHPETQSMLEDLTGEDLNGDGVEELIIEGLDILSMKDGESYRYFDMNGATGSSIRGFAPCEKGVFEMYTDEIFRMCQYNYYRANPESAEFLTGVVYDTKTDKWYRSLDGGTENTQPISEAEARGIMDAHPQEEIQWIPLVKFGQPYTFVAYSDPYAAYIANILDRFSNGEDFTYTLMDLNGDGVQELIIKMPDAQNMGIYTILNGEIKDYAFGVTYICEGNILEECEIWDDTGRRYYGFYRCGAEEAEFIEKVVRDPYTLYWGHAFAGQDGKTIREDQAWEIINSYKHIDLTMKSFTEYPLR